MSENTALTFITDPLLTGTVHQVQFLPVFFAGDNQIKNVYEIATRVVQLFIRVIMCLVRLIRYFIAMKDVYTSRIAMVF
jgi:hypothetical protein